MRWMSDEYRAGVSPQPCLFLVANKVYSDVPIILIDDPSQSLDEVNIASLGLTCYAVSSIIASLSYLHMKKIFLRTCATALAALVWTTSSLNMQRLAKEAS